jgi:rhodanese-related sulfurtransferase
MKKSILFTILILVFFTITGCVKQEIVQPSNLENNLTNNSVSPFVFTEKSFDFGKIKQSGGKVSHDFVFTYNGENEIEITGVPTSCACTSAVISKTKFKKGETGILTVSFNPNLHEEPTGQFYKSISLLTSPKLETMPEVKIWVEIDLDLGAEAFELKSDHKDEEGEEESNLISYKSITPQVFDAMLENKDFKLIDVHIPEQEHIQKTDAFIPYDEIAHKIEDLGLNKTDKIVLYCRSGSMSRAAAYQLVEEGYTNIYDLVGGKNAYDEYLSNKP